MKTALTGILLLATTVFCSANLLVHESYQYTPGSLPGTATTGTGLTGIWEFTAETGSAATVLPTSMPFAGHFAPVGGSLQLNDTTGPWGEKMLGAQISAPMTGNSILWQSSLIQVSSPDGSFYGDWVVEQRMHIGATNGYEGNNAIGPGLRNLGRAYNSSGSDSQGGVGANFSEVKQGTGSITAGINFLMVSRFHVSTANNQTTAGQIWFFREGEYAAMQAAAIGGSPRNTALLDAHAYASLADGDGGFDISGPRYLQYVIQGGPIGTYDEFRMGTQLGDVINVVPEPTTATLVLLTVGGLALVRRRR